MLENFCPFYYGNAESIMHIFVNCLFDRNCWYSSIVSYCRGSFVDFNDWLLFVLSNSTTNKKYIVMII